MPAPAEEMDEDELLAELSGAAGAADITELRHVRTAADKRAAEEIANRETCEDFDRFKPLFAAGAGRPRQRYAATRPFVKDAGFLKADITAGKLVHRWRADRLCRRGRRVLQSAAGQTDARLRVIYSQRDREQPASPLATAGSV